MGGQSPGNCLVTCAAHSFTLFFIDVNSPTGMFLAKLSITYILVPLAPTDCFDMTRRVLPPCVENIFQTVLSPPSLENRDRTETEGGRLPSNPSPTPSLTRNARWISLPTHHPLPCFLRSKSKTEGAIFLPTRHHPPSSLEM